MKLAEHDKNFRDIQMFTSILCLFYLCVKISELIRILEIIEKRKHIINEYRELKEQRFRVYDVCCKQMTINVYVQVC